MRKTLDSPCFLQKCGKKAEITSNFDGTYAVYMDICVKNDFLRLLGTI